VEPMAEERPAPTPAPRAEDAQTDETEGPKAKPPTAPASASAPGSVRHFEFIGGSSRKFWEISASDNSFTVRFGRIGTSGQSQTKTFADEAKANLEAEKLIAEKVKKGYTEKET